MFNLLFKFDLLPPSLRVHHLYGPHINIPYWYKSKDGTWTNERFVRFKVISTSTTVSFGLAEIGYCSHASQPLRLGSFHPAMKTIEGWFLQSFGTTESWPTQMRWIGCRGKILQWRNMWIYLRLFKNTPAAFQHCFICLKTRLRSPHYDYRR